MVTQFLNIRQALKAAPAVTSMIMHIRGRPLERIPDAELGPSITDALNRMDNWEQFGDRFLETARAFQSPEEQCFILTVVRDPGRVNKPNFLLGGDATGQFMAQVFRAGRKPERQGEILGFLAPWVRTAFPTHLELFRDQDAMQAAQADLSVRYYELEGAVAELHQETPSFKGSSDLLHKLEDDAELLMGAYKLFAGGDESMFQKKTDIYRYNMSFHAACYQLIYEMIMRKNTLRAEFNDSLMVIRCSVQAQNDRFREFVETQQST